MGSGFGRLVVSSGSSNLADGVFQVALPLITLGVTRDPGAFAIVMLASRLPWLLFALPAGALADRLDRRRTMLLVNLSRATLLGGLALAVATGSETLWLLSGVAFALGTAETLFDTAAQSIVPNLVPGDELSRSNGRLFAVELTMNQFVGPPLGGLLVGLAAAAAVAGSAGAYLGAAVAIAVIAGSFRPKRDGPPTRLRQDVVDGVRYLFSHRVLRTLALLTGIINLTGTAMNTLLPIYAVGAESAMRLPEAGYGLLLGAGAFGSLAGSFVAPWFERVVGQSKTLLATCVVSVVWIAMPGITASVFAVGAVWVLAGVGTVTWNVITVSLRQRIAPDHLLGRVNAGYRLLAWGSMPLGALSGGVLGELFGLRPAFLTASAACLTTIPLLLVVVTPHALAAAQDEAEAEEEAAETA